MIEIEVGPLPAKGKARILFSILGVVGILVGLWLLGNEHTPLVSGNPVVLTRARRATLEYLNTSSEWATTLELYQVELAQLMPVPASPETAAVVADAVVTTTAGLTLTVPVALTLVAPEEPAALPGDFLARMEQLQWLHARLDHVGYVVERQAIPGGLHTLSDQAINAIAAGLTWNEALQAYYAAPYPEVLPLLAQLQQEMATAVVELRIAVVERQRVITSGEAW
jgi:hypothetical protein